MPPFAVTRCDQRRAPMMHFCDSFDAYFGRIIGSHALSFARTMRRRRAPERHDGHWGLAAGARAGALRAGFPRERDRLARPAFGRVLRSRADGPKAGEATAGIGRIRDGLAATETTGTRSQAPLFGA